MNERPTHIDLCSGLGGFALAFQRAGFETIAFAEIDQACSQHLKKKFPRVTNYGDLRNVPAIKCTVVSAGDPCQPFSIAGKRRGYEDDRYLWPSVLDVITESDADFFLGENVVGIANMVLSRRIDDLEARGYQSVAFDIPSCGIGLQSVERHVWLVAARSGEGFAGRIFSPDTQNNALQEFLRGYPGNDRGRVLPKSRTMRSRKGISKRIHALGNAATPPIVEIFARAIKNFLDRPI